MAHDAAFAADHERLSQWRRERRRAARTHHPDVGGDLDQYLRVVSEIDARLGPSDRPPARAGATTTVSGRRTAMRRRLRTATREAHRLSRRVRSRLPRGVPGARRWTEL